MKFNQTRPFILASGSPRRKEYFERYGFDFTIQTADIAEIPKKDELPLDFACRMAIEKGKTVLATLPDEDQSLVFSADTIVLLEGEIIGKPSGPEAVLPMLQKLQGKKHQVIAAYSIAGKGSQHLRSETTDVTFYTPDPSFLEAYAKTTEPLDKAGSYSIQGAGSFLVESIQGSYNNVVGLPMERLLQDLFHLGFITPFAE